MGKVDQVYNLNEVGKIKGKAIKIKLHIGWMMYYHCRKMTAVSPFIHWYVQCVHIPYSQKFSPGENFCLFHPGVLWAKILSANYFT